MYSIAKALRKELSECHRELPLKKKTVEIEIAYLPNRLIVPLW